MKNVLSVLMAVFSVFVFAQSKTAVKKAPVKKAPVKKAVIAKPNPDLAKINDSIPALIPQKMDGKFGFINQKGKILIKHQ